MLLDLDRSVHAGLGTDASVETAVTIAASVAMRTLADNRSVAIFLAGLFIGLGILLGNAVK